MFEVDSFLCFMVCLEKEVEPLFCFRGQKTGSLRRKSSRLGSDHVLGWARMRAMTSACERGVGFASTSVDDGGARAAERLSGAAGGSGVSESFGAIAIVFKVGEEDGDASKSFCLSPWSKSGWV